MRAAGPHEPVGVDLASSATARIDAESRVAERRTGRRLALTAIAVAIVLTTTFCGTGIVANAEQERTWRLYVSWSRAVSEYDCCTVQPRGRGVGVCADAVEDLDLLHERLATTTWAASMSAAIQRVTGISPELFSVNRPNVEEVKERFAACHR